MSKVKKISKGRKLSNFRFNLCDETDLILPLGLNVRKNLFVVVIGAGGVGSYAIPNIMRTMKILGQEHICIIDGDKVEVGNIERQNFSMNDIGKNKAAVLAERYGNHFGLKTSSSSEFINSPQDLFNILQKCSIRDMELFDMQGFAPYILLISCVDNISSRQHIYNLLEGDYFAKNKKGLFPFQIAWLDSGNTERSGQVIGKIYSKEYFQQGFHQMEDAIGKTIFDLYPKMLLPIDDAPNPAMSCGRAGGTQTSLINRMVAYTLEIMASKLIYSYALPKDEFANGYHYYQVVAANGMPMMEFCQDLNPFDTMSIFTKLKLIGKKLSFDNFVEFINKSTSSKRPVGVTRKSWRALRRGLKVTKPKPLSPFLKYDEVCEYLMESTKYGVTI